MHNVTVSVNLYKDSKENDDIWQFRNRVDIMPMGVFFMDMSLFISHESISKKLNHRISLNEFRTNSKRQMAHRKIIITLNLDRTGWEMK